MNTAKQALQHIDAGNWDLAHQLVQDQPDNLSCLIHAWLHRDEGDMSNASYWYHRAGEAMPDNTLTEELERLRALADDL